MIEAIFFAALGLSFMVLGGIFILASIMPTFGDSRNDGAMTSNAGIALIILGAALVFYGGTWI